MPGRVRKGFFISAGVLSVGLGTAGIFLPILPTTPFLLLAAACFIRSSERLYQWLISHRWFGPYIKNYREYNAITARTKAVVLILLWATLGYSALWVVNGWGIRSVLFVIGVGVTLHLLKLKTLPRKSPNRSRCSEKEDISLKK